MNNKVLAIICEYNPFHSGHKHLIDKAKEITNSNYVVGLMSGNFSQRSLPCILDKFTRSEIAVLNGIDLTLNLPTAFCTNNAEIFALASIKILNNIGVDYLAFGVETLNEKTFNALANFLLKEPKSFKKELKQNLKSGLSYNNAIVKTIQNNLHFFEKDLQQDIINILTKANNILALEYVKALIKTNSKIKPIFVERVDNYNDNIVIKNFASASNIRENLLQKNFEKIKEFLPENSHKFYNEISLDLNLFKTLILYKIKTIKNKDLKQIYSVNEGLENKLKNEAEKTISFDEFYLNINSKRYKENKINAVLLNALLNIDKKIIKKLYTIKTNIYIKILALNKQKADIFNHLSTKFLISRKNDINKCTFNKFNKRLFEIEKNANIVYNLIAKTKLLENDLYNKMIVTNI